MTAGRSNRDRVLAEFRYSHPIFTVGRRAAQKRHGELIRHNRTSFCGAYWGNGFHEDGVNSALAVLKGFAADDLVDLDSDNMSEHTHA